MVDPENVFGFNYILENKTHPDDVSMEERELVLGESYEVVMVTNEDIKIVKDCRIPYYGKK
jgi:hypothetical protein